MKISTFLSVVLFLMHSIPAGADGHEDELKMIGQRIKEAVRDGKLTEKEGWAKWKAVQEKYHDHEEMDESDDRIVELELEMKARELEMEIERMEKEHELEIRALDFQLQRMESEFDRERRIGKWSGCIGTANAMRWKGGCKVMILTTVTVLHTKRVRAKVLDGGLPCLCVRHRVVRHMVVRGKTTGASPSVHLPRKRQMIHSFILSLS